MRAIPTRKAVVMKQFIRATKIMVTFLLRYLFLALIIGPKNLLTSRISNKCAAIIAAMCLPALLSCAVLMLPEILFQHPHQNVYFQFAQMLQQDPIRWFAFALSGLCAFSSLAIPATMPAPPRPAFY